jgi:hypothetical protein
VILAFLSPVLRPDVFGYRLINILIYACITFGRPDFRQLFQFLPHGAAVTQSSVPPMTAGLPESFGQIFSLSAISGPPVEFHTKITARQHCWKQGD